MHLPNLGLRKGGWYKLESGEESLEWEALGRVLRSGWGIVRVPIYLGFTTTIFLAPPRGK